MKTSFDPEADPVTSPRAEITQIPAARRRLNFEEVERPWCESEAIIQAQRCLRCDYGKPLRSAIRRMHMHRITINGISTEADQNTTILAAATQMGIHIPTLCHLEGLSPTGACRVCVVEIEGAEHLAAACSTPVRDGMVIRTHSKRVREARTTVVELLLSEHEGDCQTCQRSSDCELRELARELRVLENRYTGEKPMTMIDASTPALYRDSGKCIKCAGVWRSAPVCST